jgi:hypothetical protein
MEIIRRPAVLAMRTGFAAEFLNPGDLIKEPIDHPTSQPAAI